MAKNPSSDCFWSHPSPAGEGRRILLVSYHFPPGQAAGALRWQKLAGFAPKWGWQLDVVTLDPRCLASVDERRFADLPAGTRLFAAGEHKPRLEQLEEALIAMARRVRRRSRRAGGGAPGSVERGPSSIARSELRFDPLSLTSWRRANGAILDHLRQSTWARSALRVARRVLGDGRHRLILSCGPPHLAHEVARRLARESGLPGAIDLRDPWSLNERVPEWQASPVLYRIAEHFESRIVPEAALIVMNTEPARDAMRARHPGCAERIIAVPNGFDEQAPPPVENRRRFVIAYAGSVYLDRSPEMLFRASKQVIDSLELSPEEFGIEFMGHVGEIDGRGLDEMVRDSGVDAYVRFHPPGSLAEVERFLARAAVLISLPQDSHLAIPSKVFDYMRYPAWLLALASRGSATALLLRDTDARVVQPDDEAELVRVLCDLVEKQRAGRFPAPLSNHARFSRRSQAERLYEAIEGVVCRAPCGRG